MKSAILIAMCAISSAQVTLAQDTSITVLSVSAADRRDDGALRARIKAAIDRGCGVASAEPYAEWSAIARCRRTAQRDVESQLDRLPSLEGQGIELALRR